MNLIKPNFTSICILVCLMYSGNIFAQVGIGTNTPNSSAMLEINSNSKGLLIPKMTADQRAAISLPSKGLIVYQTDGTEGFYYNSGTAGIPNWISFLTTSSGADGWNLTGNAGTNPADNFIGTTDAQALDFRTNNILKMRITTKGQIETYNTGSSIFIGKVAGANDDLNNRLNVFIGDSSGYSNTEGVQNTAIGYSSLRSNTTAFNNTAIGYLSLYSNSTGTTNSAFGSFSLTKNATGSLNTAIGTSTLRNNISGGSNTALGFSALNQNMMGNNNTAIGDFVLYMNTSGVSNTAIGSSTLGTNTIGSYNTVVGAQSLVSFQSSGNYITGLGYNVDVDADNRTNVVVIGGNSNLPLDGNNRVRIGNSSMSSIGGQVSWTTISDERVKENVASDVGGLPFIMKLNPVTYNYSIQKSTQFNSLKSAAKWEGKYDIEKIKFSGFFAQEVEKAAKETGYNFSGIDKPDNPNGLYGLRYSDFVVPLVKAVQELSIENNLLKEKLLKQENYLDTLKKEIEQINKMLR